MTADQPGAFTVWRHNARVEAVMYLRHVWGLVIPGVRVRVVPVHNIQPTSLDDWRDDALRLLVDEGRRQLDRQSARFDRVRTNAQFLFTTALALLVVLAAAARRTDGLLMVAWAFGLAVVALGLLGAASLLTVRSDFGTIDTAKLTESGPAPLAALADAYAHQVGTGENTVAARITVYRDAVWLVLLGALIQLIVWIANIW
jgi:hypothetical protein